MREVQGSSSGWFAPPGRIPEHEPVTENDQDSFPDAKAQSSTEPLGATSEPAKRADLGGYADAVERAKHPESVAHAPGEEQGLARNGEDLAGVYNFQRDESPSRSLDRGGGELRPATSVMEYSQSRLEGVSGGLPGSDQPSHRGPLRESRRPSDARGTSIGPTSQGGSPEVGHIGAFGFGNPPSSANPHGASRVRGANFENWQTINGTETRAPRRASTLNTV